MANKKFSQFTLAADVSEIDFVVGYKDLDNIQIDPAELDSLYGLNSVPKSGPASPSKNILLPPPPTGTEFNPYRLSSSAGSI